MCVDELTRMTGKLMDDRKDWFLKPNDDDGDGFDDGYDDHGGCSDNGYVNVADEKGVPGLRKNNSTDMSCPVMFHVGLVLFGHIKSCDKECPSTRLGIVHGG